MSEQTPEPTPAEPAAPKPAPPAEQQPPAEPKAPTNPWEDAEAAKAEIEKLRKENAAARVNAKQQAAQEARDSLVQEFGKLLGLVKDDAPVTPEQLTAQLTASQQSAKDAQLELAIHRAAAAKKLAADELLDSRTFMARAQQIDPTDTAALDALLGEVTAGNTRYRATPAAPQGGADLGPGGQAQPRTYTQAQLADHDFYMKNRADILAAQREGRIR